MVFVGLIKVFSGNWNLCRKLKDMFYCKITMTVMSCSISILVFLIISNFVYSFLLPFHSLFFSFLGELIFNFPALYIVFVHPVQNSLMFQVFFFLFFFQLRAPNFINFYKELTFWLKVCCYSWVYWWNQKFQILVLWQSWVYQWNQKF